MQIVLSLQTTEWSGSVLQTETAVVGSWVPKVYKIPISKSPPYASILQWTGSSLGEMDCDRAIFFPSQLLTDVSLCMLDTHLYRGAQDVEIIEQSSDGVIWTPARNPKLSK